MDIHKENKIKPISIILLGVFLIFTVVVLCILTNPILFLVIPPTFTFTPAPTHTPARTPIPTPTPTPDLPAIYAAMKPVAFGSGVQGAGAFDTNRAGPHRLVLLTLSGSPHAWNDLLPMDWLARSVSEAELVIVGQEREINLGSHEYIGGPPITRYRFEMRVEVREARTGATLWATTLAGTEPGQFPAEAPANLVRIEGSHVAFEELEEFLSGWVNRPALWQELLMLEGFEGLVDDLAFSPDGEILASEYHQGIKLWQVSDGALLREWYGQEEIADISFSPDGRILAAGERDRTSMSTSFGMVELWQVSDGSLLHRWEVRTEYGVFGVTFSPDGQILATRSYDSAVRLWRVSDATLLLTLEGRWNVDVVDISFSLDGKQLAVGYSDHTIGIWRVADGFRINTLGENTVEVEEICLSPDWQILALGFADGTVELRQVSDGQLLHKIEGYIPEFGIQFSPDGQTLSFISNGKLQLWSVSDGVLERTIYEIQRGWLDLTFSPDGQMLAFMTKDLDLYLWRK